MAGTYKITELVGTSPVSFAEAAKAAVAEAAKTIRHMEWFQIAEESAVWSCSLDAMVSP